ncbi:MULTISPECIES: tRNA (N6-isopentenyl adenosine(37)-C2)-methylthiotransferase MiaB [unclassified Marinitoga]|uniref:tRNA (N6-isopentenyl adenosine(37)-C2)-methylthiotransferase MiaB n=1 Tax=unclassified Marinitoga TaxID=2640159 RepID=UPI000640FBC6|nr:tRNA (N6-isopentenyl adenosine(37)-C2)-methylthiotransferase MiaB [Marinitoga sp. 1155]KLO23898.1 (dimethylallyl)adenosine tRNA methylthiotransferase [Marinitoga sp. 1155]NUU99120.1 (dimethylallyl)adenosine tRNA methylthiotransferase [Marinitoga sp. 1154]
MKFYIKTFGCQMNVNESEIMTGILEKEGFEWTENPQEADFIILNSCAVREKAEHKLYGAIGHYEKLKRKNKNIIIGVGGCVAEKERSEILKRFHGVDFVFGTRNYMEIKELYLNAKNGKRFADFSDKFEEITADLPKHPYSKHHGWINIIYGCNKYCTYCIVPYTRHLEKSRPIEDIIKEVEYYNDKNYREITFLGQNVDSYGKDFGDGKPKLDILIKEASKFDSIKRIWFLTSYPTDITDRLINEVANNEKAAKNFHLPVQAGSDNILKKMNRRYTKEFYLELIKDIKSRVPNVTISGDIIVGFPGETESDFMETVDLIKKVRYERLNIAEYSPREGTISAKYYKDDIPKRIKNKRFQYLMNIQKQINHEENEKYLNKTVMVIQENKIKSGAYLGRTINNKVVIFKSDENMIGKFVKIKINKISAGPLYGEIIATEKDSDFNTIKYYI